MFLLKIEDDVIDSAIDLEMIAPVQFDNSFLNDRLGRLRNPIIHDKLDLPKSRSVHVNMLNTIDEDDYKSLEFINSIERDRLVVYNKATVNKPEGRLIIKKRNITPYDMGIKKKFKNARTVKTNDKLVLGNRDLMVFNYKFIHENYIYQQHKTKEYARLVNSMNTMFDEINEKGIFQYNIIILDIPTDIPKVDTLKRLTFKKVDNSTLNIMKSVDSLLVYELWKMFFRKANSIFNNIKVDRRDNTILAFVSNGKYTYYKLADILAMSKPLGVLSKRMKATNELNAAKNFLLSLLLFQRNSTLDDKALKGLTGLDSVSDDDFDDVDDLLEDFDVIEESDDSDSTSPEDDVVIENTSKQNNKDFTKLVDNHKDNVNVIKEKIEKHTKDRLVSKSENSKLTDVADTQLENTFVINGKTKKLDEILDYSNIDSELRPIPMKASKSVIDTSMVENSNRSLDKEYLEKMYHKDVFNAIYSIQNANVVITKHTTSVEKSFLGESVRHTLELKPLDGLPSTIQFVIPVISEDGTYRMSSNEYMLRPQRKDLPIRKTSPTEVLLTSYNSMGKLFITKNLYQKDNPSAWFAKHINNNEAFTNVIMKSNKPYDLELPKPYTLIASEVSRFRFKSDISFVFDYRVRLSLLSVDEEKKVLGVEKKHDMIFIGKRENGKSKYYMDRSGIIWKESSGTLHNRGDIEGYFQLDFRKMPSESANIKILGKVIPLGLVMLNYVGLDKLLELLNTKPARYKLEDKYKLSRDEFAVHLSDGTLVFKRDDYMASLIFYGLPKEVLSSMSYADLNNKDSLDVMYNLFGLSITHINAISNIETLFLDNITKDALRLMGEPTDIHRLLIRAVEMLVDDNYKNPNNITDNALVKYERVAGLIYRSLSRAYSSYTNRNSLSKARIQLDPYEIWRAIGDDSTSSLVEDNNPIALIKQRDNVTFLGEFGRSKITMTLPTRVMTPEEVGIISEATPDSGDSGISTYLTHSASLSNLRGMVKPIDISQSSINKALSSANIINPFITTDDPKRANFSSIQSSHIIPMIDMKSQRCWTGAESTIAHKVGKPFVYTADSSGRVEKVTRDSVVVKYSKPKDSNVVLLLSDVDDPIWIREVYDIISDKGYNVTTDPKQEVKYKVYLGDGDLGREYIRIKENKFLLSSLRAIPNAETIDTKKTYSLRSWSAKIEGGVSIRHNMATALRVNDKVLKDDIITYDSSFFEPNIYDNNSIVIKMGTRARVAFLENKSTLEDSAIFNSNILKRTGEVRYKIVSKILTVDDHIANVIPEGSEVKYNDRLMTIVDSVLVRDTSLTDRAREILADANDKSPKANANGLIDRIDVIYNCELGDMDESIRVLAEASNKRFMEERGVTGKVTNEYSIKGKPLLSGEIELKYYISSVAETVIGDKFVIGHQMKFTTGDIYDDIYDESGRPVDIIFGNRSVLARIVNSAYIQGTTNLLMEYFTDNSVKAYKGK